jgi:NAD(P)H-dependent FMN reductase
MKLAVITGTSRTGRQTPRQSQWIVNTANKVDGVTAEHVDIKDYPLPFFSEAVSPRYNPDRVPTADVQAWLDTLAGYDAYIFVTPEYNHSIPGELKNAFDYLTWELKHKPSAVASHGTVGGARAAMHLKEILSEAQSVVIPKFSVVSGMSEVISEAGELDATVAANPYGPQGQLEGLLDELKWYSDALSAARAKS